MRKLLARSLVAISFTLMIVFVALSLLSCAKRAAPYFLMSEFCSEYGINDTVFSPSVPEGKDGYISGSFFKTVYGESDDLVCDYAVVFLSSLDNVGECAVFLCYSDYDALLACDILYRRIELLKSMGTGMDTSYVLDASVFKSGKYVVMCALSDNVRAEKIWRKIL